MSKYHNKDIHQLPSWDVNDNYDDDDNDDDDDDNDNNDDNDNGSFDVQSYEDIDDDDFIAKLEKEIGRNNIDSSSTYNGNNDLITNTTINTNAYNILYSFT